MLYLLFISCFWTRGAVLFICVSDINFRYPQNIRHFVIFPCTWYSLLLLCSQQWEPSTRWYLLKNISFHWEAQYEKKQVVQCYHVRHSTCSAPPIYRPALTLSSAFHCVDNISSSAAFTSDAVCGESFSCSRVLLISVIKGTGGQSDEHWIVINLKCIRSLFFSAELWGLQYLMSFCKPHVTSSTSRSARAQCLHR